MVAVVTCGCHGYGPEFWVNVSEVHPLNYIDHDRLRSRDKLDNLEHAG